MTCLQKNFSIVRRLNCARVIAVRSIMTASKMEQNPWFQRQGFNRQWLEQRRSRSTIDKPWKLKGILNAITSTKNAAKKRSHQPNSEEDTIAMIEQASREEANANAQGDSEMATVNKVIDTEQEIQTLRDFLFDKQEHDDSNDQQRAADMELLSRITAQHTNTPMTLSPRVINPYISYKNHRVSWAEFRRNMIYGKP